MKELATSADPEERNNDVEMVLVAITEVNEYTVNGTVIGSKNDQTVSESGNNRDDDDDLNTSEYQNDISNNSTKMTAPGNEKFLLTATEEKLAFPVDAKILDDPNVWVADTGATCARLLINMAFAILSREKTRTKLLWDKVTEVTYQF